MSNKDVRFYNRVYDQVVNILFNNKEYFDIVEDIFKANENVDQLIIKYKIRHFIGLREAVILETQKVTDNAYIELDSRIEKKVIENILLGYVKHELIYNFEMKKKWDNFINELYLSV